jgi:hypothetical protein
LGSWPSTIFCNMSAILSTLMPSIISLMRRPLHSFVAIHPFCSESSSAASSQVTTAPNRHSMCSHTQAFCLKDAPPPPFQLMISRHRVAPPRTSSILTTISAWPPTCRSGSTIPPPTGSHAQRPWAHPRESICQSLR